LKVVRTAKSSPIWTVAFFPHIVNCLQAVHNEFYRQVDQIHRSLAILTSQQQQQLLSTSSSNNTTNNSSSSNNNHKSNIQSHDYLNSIPGSNNPHHTEDHNTNSSSMMDTNSNNTMNPNTIVGTDEFNINSALLLQGFGNIVTVSGVYKEWLRRELSLKIAEG